ncbi:DNA repair protein RadA [Enterobacter cloacae]|uniref:DNA repair protein RadA n=1 Tax=Enterobacter cloacae TaxID=550 RepID=A0A377M7H9_ENTCL|nr:DNA repair protein RadA [Enterobacter cloacae]
MNVVRIIPRWQGQCSACHAWNTITEVRGVAASPSVARNERLSGYAGNAGVAKVQKLSEISLEALPRFSTGFKEFDRVLGGGVVPGSAILIGGNPGAGKSTLLLQTLCKLAEQMKTLYVTGEESLQQVAMRAHRLGLPTGNLNMLSETSIEQICMIAEEEQPKLMVIDSIQVMHMADIQSSPGSVAQVRETAAYLTRFAKTRGVAIVMVGHVTKDGSLAGPKVLEHCIDCSVMLDGDADSRFRTLRSHKNRFGAVNELGVFAMTEQGLREVSNPSAIFLSRGDEVTSGSSVMVLWEGTRPLLVEIQALVDHSMMGNPRRVAVGLEQNRLAILLAVLHRHGGLQMADQDVFVNVVGGRESFRDQCRSGAAAGDGLPVCVTDRCRRIWWSSAKWGWPGRSARCPAARSASPRRRNMASAGRLCRRPTCRRRSPKGCRSLALKNSQMR